MQNGKKADPDQTAPFGSTVFASLSHFVQNIGIWYFPKSCCSVQNGKQCGPLSDGTFLMVIWVYSVCSDGQGDSNKHPQS